MSTDGTGVVQLTTNASIDWQPRWSPDGTKIVFTTSRDGNYEIYTMNADGTSPLRLTNNTPFLDYYPKWSPDGTKIAFYTNRDVNYEVYTMNADGTSPTNISNDPGIDQYPDWSPDGTRIAFASTRVGIPAGADYNVWSMSPTGGSITQLTNDTGLDYQPSYSPDGTRIYFTSSRDYTGASVSYEIYSMTSGGASETRFPIDTETTQEHPSAMPLWQTRYIGTGGRLGAACAGFLFGQAGTATTSVLTFDTVGASLSGRAAARIVANSPGDSSLSNLFLTLTTTVGLQSISYVNTLGAVSLFPAVVSIPVPSGTTGALIAYSGTGVSAGQVTSVLPYAANRSASSKPAYNGDSVTYTEHFTAVFDASGKNLAPGGAKSVTLEEKTGKLLYFK